jgi:hypothetical protein
VVVFVGVWQGVEGALTCGGVCWSLAGCGGCIGVWCTKMWQGMVRWSVLEYGMEYNVAISDEALGCFWGVEGCGRVLGCDEVCWSWTLGLVGPRSSGP